MGACCGKSASKNMAAESSPCEQCQQMYTRRSSTVKRITESRYPNGMSADPATYVLKSPANHTAALNCLLDYVAVLRKHANEAEEFLEGIRERVNSMTFRTAEQQDVYYEKLANNVRYAQRAAADYEEAVTLYMETLARFKKPKKVYAGASAPASAPAPVPVLASAPVSAPAPSASVFWPADDDKSAV